MSRDFPPGCFPRATRAVGYKWRFIEDKPGNRKCPECQLSSVEGVEGVKSQLIQMAENEAGFCVSRSFKVSMKEDVHD